MGLILDSSVLITAERQGQNARQMLAAISGKAGKTDIAVSVVTLIELAHGAARADTSQRKEKRRQFIQELLTALPETVLAGMPNAASDGACKCVVSLRGNEQNRSIPGITADQIAWAFSNASRASK